MRANILCAGFGTRLRPFTYLRPPRRTAAVSFRSVPRRGIRPPPARTTERDLPQSELHSQKTDASPCTALAGPSSGLPADPSGGNRQTALAFFCVS